MTTRNGEYFRHGLILGVLVGLLAALLVAPSSGRQLRDRLAAHFSGLTPGAGSPTAPASEGATIQSSTL